jgi:hypothetical protein
MPFSGKQMLVIVGLAALTQIVIVPAVRRITGMEG